jgi:hypothetical protein
MAASEIDPDLLLCGRRSSHDGSAAIVLRLAWESPRAQKVNSHVFEAVTVAVIPIVVLLHSRQIPQLCVKMGYIKGSTKDVGSSGQVSDLYHGGSCSNLGPTEGFRNFS